MQLHLHHQRPTRQCFIANSRLRKGQHDKSSSWKTWNTFTYWDLSTSSNKRSKAWKRLLREWTQRRQLTVAGLLKIQTSLGKIQTKLWTMPTRRSRRATAKFDRCLMSSARLAFKSTKRTFRRRSTWKGGSTRLDRESRSSIRTPLSRASSSPWAKLLITPVPVLWLCKSNRASKRSQRDRPRRSQDPGSLRWTPQRTSPLQTAPPTWWATTT